MEAAARKVRIAAGSDHITGQNGATDLAKAPNDFRFPPGAADPVYKEVALASVQARNSNDGLVRGALRFVTP